MKNILKESLIIILFSVALALIYNKISDKPLHLIAEAPKKVNTSTLDSLASLTSSSIDTTKKDIASVNKIEIAAVEKAKDTSAKIKNKITKEDLQKIEVEKIKQDAAKEKDNLQKTVTYEQVKEKINDPRFFYIDARNAEDYSKSHIGNAINLFPHPDDESKYMEKIFTLPRDKVFIIYCNGGTCDLSHKLAQDMINAGHKNIFIFTGGWDEWTKNGNK